MQKPLQCDQYWADMTPADGGRVCGKCEKLIVDFRKKSWAEIQQTHTQSSEPVCGMYSKKQLRHWGHEIPSGNCTKFAATFALFSVLGLSQAANAQNSGSLEDREIILTGKIWFQPLKGDAELLPSARIGTDDGKFATFSNKNGEYELKIPGHAYPDSLPVILISEIGLAVSEVKLTAEILAEGKIDVTLENEKPILLKEKIVDGAAYYSPSTRNLPERVKKSFDRRFRRNRK